MGTVCHGLQTRGGCGDSASKGCYLMGCIVPDPEDDCFPDCHRGEECSLLRQTGAVHKSNGAVGVHPRMMRV